MSRLDTILSRVTEEYAQGMRMRCENCGKITEIQDRGGSFEFDLWVKAPSKSQEVNAVKTENRFKVLEEDEQEDSKEGFARQDNF